eukprot:TRINITY_DN4620_c0_g1_i2.p1 TRINITY_DN4620_c0_g1~~TRINITY_DN4620_c0_g1_i2.p1  ORF type:complete len:327 (+),score=64.72 TRINITY_DN4620_c0_g1_i2:217-1197(+)
MIRLEEGSDSDTSSTSSQLTAVSNTLITSELLSQVDGRLSMALDNASSEEKDIEGFSEASNFISRRKRKTEERRQSVKISLEINDIKNSIGHDDERIKFNVGGKIFITRLSTLQAYPDTLLGAMFNQRNRDMLSPDENGYYFFDRDPNLFEIILNFYRNGMLSKPDWIPLQLVKNELEFFGIDIYGTGDRMSAEIRKLEYQQSILNAEEYRKATQTRLLNDHHATITLLIESFAEQVELNSLQGNNICTVTFLSPIHYTDSTPRDVFKVISKNAVRDLIVEMLESKNFEVETTSEYSKTKSTNIIGLADQIINYNDPKFFTFTIRW